MYIFKHLKEEREVDIKETTDCIRLSTNTWEALAQTVTHSNFEIADATFANTRCACTALSLQLSGRSCNT